MGVAPNVISARSAIHLGLLLAESVGLGLQTGAAFVTPNRCLLMRVGVMEMVAAVLKRR